MKTNAMRAAQVALLAMLGCAPKGEDEPVIEPAAAQETAAPRAPDACGGAHPAALLDVGHAGSVLQVVRSGDAVLSAGRSRWVLWNVAQGRQLASGARDSGNFSWRFQPQLRGNTALVPRTREGRTIDVRDARDARVLSTVDIGSTYAELGLASDGSYVWRADGQELRVLTRDGALLFGRVGDYANAAIHAAPDALYVAARPDGSGEIEVLPVREGVMARGQKLAARDALWLADGGRLLVPAGDDAALYDLTGKLLHTVVGGAHAFEFSRNSLGGVGPLIWEYPQAPQTEALRITQIGAAKPLVELALPFEGSRSVEVGSGGTVLGISSRTSATLHQVDLRVLSSSVPPRLAASALVGNVDSYDSDARGAWVVGLDRGLLQVGEPGAAVGGRTLGCGEVLAVASAPTGRVAIATNDGVVRVYDTQGASRLVSVIAAHTTAVAITPDGKHVVTRGARPYIASSDSNAPDQSVRVFAADDGALVHRFPHAQGDQPAFMDFDLSADGRLARRLCTLGAIADGNPRTCVVEVTDLRGAPLFRTEPVSWNEPGNPSDFEPPLWSPSGRRLAFAVPQPARGWWEADTVLYEDGRLLRRFAGRVLSWVDDTHLLIATSTSAQVVDLQGRAVTTTADLAVGNDGRRVDDLHYRKASSIHRLRDGVVVWSVARLGIEGRIEAATGDYVVVRDQERVHVARWR